MSGKSKRLNWFSRVTIGIFIWVLFSWVLALAVIGFVEHRYHVKVDGKVFLTHWMPGRFRLSNPMIIWKNNLRVTSGNIDVSLNSVSLSNQTMMVTLHGRNLEAEMGKKKYPIRQADVVLEFQKSDEPIIHSFKIDSPMIQMNLREK